MNAEELALLAKQKKDAIMPRKNLLSASMKANVIERVSDEIMSKT